MGLSRFLSDHVKKQRRPVISRRPAIININLFIARRARTELSANLLAEDRANLRSPED